MAGTASMPLFWSAIAAATGIEAALEDIEGNADSDSSRPPEPDEVMVATARMYSMTSSRRASGSVAFAVERLQQLARAVRDQMSTSTWMVLGAIDRAIAELGSPPAVLPGSGAETTEDLDGSELGRAHEEILHGLLALAGLQAESMVRDAGWLF